MKELTMRVLEVLEKHFQKLESPRDYGWRTHESVAEELGCREDAGISRMVFLFEEKRVVFKFTDPCWGADLCEAEMRMYESAKAKGIAECLLPNTLVGTLSNGVRIYSQPMYDSCLDNVEEKDMNVMLDECVENIREVNSLHRAMPTDIDFDWFRIMCHKFGTKFVSDFVKWSQEVDIKDLHGGNIGFLNGKPVINDYFLC